MTKLSFPVTGAAAMVGVAAIGIGTDFLSAWIGWLFLVINVGIMVAGRNSGSQNG